MAATPKSGSAGATVQVVGLADLQKALRKLGHDNRAFTKTHKAIADWLRAEGAKRAPRGDTGDLFTSLRPRATQKNARVESSLIYAGVVHWGWAKRGVPAQPFMQEALEDTRLDVADFYVAMMYDLGVKAGFKKGP